LPIEINAVGEIRKGSANSARVGLPRPVERKPPLPPSAACAQNPELLARLIFYRETTLRIRDLAGVRHGVLPAGRSEEIGILQACLELGKDMR
jgi:hypothetical protein